MVVPRVPKYGMVLIIGFLLTLLAGLAFLQYRWINEIAAAERDRARNLMRVSAERFAEDIDRELTRVFLHFRPEPANAPDQSPVLERYQRWRASAPFPDLVPAVFLIEGAQVLRADGGSGGLSPAELPPELQALVSGPPLRGGRSGFGGPLLFDPLALLMPAEAPGAPRSPGGEELSLLVVPIDQRYLMATVLPTLAKRHLPGTDAQQFALAVFAGEQKIFSSSPEPVRADFEVPLSGLRDFPDLGFPPREGHGPRGGRMFGMHGAGGPPPPPNPWRVVVSHTGGALDAAISRSKTRNLAISGAILALLAFSFVLVVIAASRLTRAAHQQLEFVAAITHELNTPLAAIRSAAQNLADGIVAEPEHVRRYGSTILEHESRLARMVGDALGFAGIISGRTAERREPVAIRNLIEAALSDAAIAGGSPFRHELVLPSDLPEVRADARMLTSALANLIQNAVRHAGTDQPVVVSAARHGNQISISVKDGGQGIPEDELPRIFEPFFRGRGAAHRSGAGLGLSIVKRVVESHGGTIAAVSSSTGTTMKVTLPADV